jgi:acyl-CoA hydrolase
VGTSSLEVSVMVDQRNEAGEWTQLTMAVFVFVARDPLNKGSAMINPLTWDTAEEKAFIEKGKGEVWNSIYPDCSFKLEYI